MDPITTSQIHSVPFESSVFDLLNDETILDHIGSYLTPNEALNARLVNRRFAILFGDSHIWKIYYKSLGLQAPATVKKRVHQFHLSPLAKQLPFWKCLKETIDSMIDFEGINLYKQRVSRSLCIIALATPELSPLHGYALHILKKHNNVPNEFSSEETLLEFGELTESKRITEGTQLFALEYLAQSPQKPKVRRRLLAALHSMTGYCSLSYRLCTIATKGLLPYISEPEILNAVLNGLQHNDPYAVQPAFDALIESDEGLDVLLNRFGRFSTDFDTIFNKHLQNSKVVNKLLQRLKIENHLRFVQNLVWALGPIADNALVQKALCEKYLSLPSIENSDAKAALVYVLGKARLTADTIKEFSDKIPLIQERAIANTFLQTAKDNITLHKKELLEALSNESLFIRLHASSLLACLVRNDPEVLETFLTHITIKEHGQVGITILQALSKVADRRDVRVALINQGPLQGRLNLPNTRRNSSMSLATIKVLSPFAREFEVREAFLERLASDDCNKVRCALIAILAPQLDHQEVRNLFLKAANGQLKKSRYSFYTPDEDWQASAIDKLGRVADLPEVWNALIEIYHYKSTSSSSKAACMRILCANKQKKTITPGDLFLNCIDDNSDLREEAHRILKNWTNE